MNWREGKDILKKGKYITTRVRETSRTIGKIFEEGSVEEGSGEYIVGVDQVEQGRA